MVVLKQIKAYDLPALFTSKPGVITCSVDNQVVVLHRKGALTFALNHDPCQRGQDFVCRRSILDCPKNVDIVSIRSSENSLLAGSKEQILELMRDRILTPRNYDGIEFLNYYTKAEWSLVQLKGGPLRIPRCVLATLTSTFQLMIHGQLNQITDEHQRNWTPLLNVSQAANMILRQKWETEDEGATSGLEFSQYKMRMRELTCIDFTWMPRLDLDEHPESDSELFFIVAHVNGVIDIWRIFTCAETQNLVGEILCSKLVFEGHIISSMKFQAVDKRIGVLAVGTTSGIVRIFRIEQQPNNDTPEIQAESQATPVPPKRKPNFVIGEGIEIWEEDGLHIETFIFSMGDRNILKRMSVDILFQKHPIYLCSSTVSIVGDGLVWKPVEHIKLAIGPIVGIGRYSDELLMCCHESGQLSLVYHKNGDVKYIDGSANSIKDGPPSKADIYRYNGFAFSANKGLAFIGKNLNCFYDHNIDKDPGKLLVFSTLSIDNTWDMVKEHFMANGCRLKPISDILLPFRYQLRTRKELDVDKFLDGPGPLEIAPDLLKLYLWTLRALNLLGEQEIGEDTQKIKKVEAVHQRRLEVEDELLQRHCISLLESIDETMLPKLNLPEAQSLCLIQQFLNSKPNLRHLSFEPAIIPAEAPKCIICESEVDFVENVEEDEDPLAESPNTKEGIIQAGKVSGLQWSKQQCSEKHSFPVCILSLLPCNFPYRSCTNCGVVCCMKPVFDMKTECPLCGDEMHSSQAFEEIDEPDDDDREGSDLDDPPGIRFLGVKAESALILP